MTPGSLGTELGTIGRIHSAPVPHALGRSRTIGLGFYGLASSLSAKDFRLWASCFITCRVQFVGLTRWVEGVGFRLQALLGGPWYL